MVITMPVGILIGFITKKWQDEITADDLEKREDNLKVEHLDQDSLTDAGKTIGMIERSLILTFILMQQYQAIGFLIAAKSVFRFGDLKESGQRKRTEYILIGTLISFILFIPIGIFTQFLNSNLWALNFTKVKRGYNLQIPRKEPSKSSSSKHSLRNKDLNYYYQTTLIGSFV